MDENPNNEWESTDVLEQIIAHRLRQCGLDNEGKVAKWTDAMLNTLRGIQDDIGPIYEYDNYQDVLTGLLYTLGGYDGPYEDGHHLIDNVRTDLENAKKGIFS